MGRSGGFRPLVGVGITSCNHDDAPIVLLCHRLFRVIPPGQQGFGVSVGEVERLDGTVEARIVVGIVRPEDSVTMAARDDLVATVLPGGV